MIVVVGRLPGIGVPAPGKCELGNEKGDGCGLLAFVRRVNLPGGTSNVKWEMRESFGEPWKDA